ncbi:L,D-transpeptidase ErfK/SrfK [Candidatus Methylobacter favarea]|uniref:L,D-transpeptidase ErfK/SrfK n=1 Tax=Candidatus Methylobacter favarea TaxID=2707345 RepID=A0A8S0Y9P3_9GAMM|nr:L,D-transpeptidase family protein [Candidatus Methylobacter favarea]CAA9890441.1 L,D-transpeptidase ErfK/SrfK [Candidatus Methylobacter favarea]
MSKSKKSIFSIILLPEIIVLSGLLGGCQNLPVFFSSEPESINATEVQPQIETVPTHQFQLADGQNIVGDLAAIHTRTKDTLPDIARHFGLGYNDITLANPAIPPWTPASDSRVLLPLHFILPDAPHKGIVLNLANMRLFYYTRQQQPLEVFTYPVGIGRQGWNTPMGLTRIANKKANPNWYVPDSIHREHAEKGAALPKVVAAGPDNPLGRYAMPLSIPGYLIHGTNKPYGIGMQISHGCVQLYPEDIEELFKKASIGMQVRIVHQPYLAAWDKNMLFLEAHEPLPKWARDKHRFQKQLLKHLKQISAKAKASVDWSKVKRVLQRSDGIPTPILKQSPDIAEISQNALQLAHPRQLYEQPVIEDLKANDWSMLVATFDNETKAQQLAAMLNHQGPPIPARKIQKDESYQVIAGPYKNKKEAKAAAQRIRLDFEINVKTLKPHLISKNE